MVTADSIGNLHDYLCPMPPADGTLVLCHPTGEIGIFETDVQDLIFCWSATRSDAEINADLDVLEKCGFRGPFHVQAVYGNTLVGLDENLAVLLDAPIAQAWAIIKSERQK